MESSKNITIRKLTERQEFAAAVDLQRIIWGFEDIDILPVRLFVVASKIGGHSFGAFDGDRMVAFAVAIPGIKPGGKAYLHSNMLGVLSEYRDFGLGRRMKLAQREDALAHGVDLMEWTFDPLELKNAAFNIEKLGAVVQRFVFNQYGTTSSALHGGLPTDRCIAEWYLKSPRVEAAVHRTECQRPEITARIFVPANIAEIRKNDPAEARQIQATVSQQFDTHFSNGLTVVGFEMNEEFGIYLLASWPSN